MAGVVTRLDWRQPGTSSCSTIPFWRSSMPDVAVVTPVWLDGRCRLRRDPGPPALTSAPIPGVHAALHLEEEGIVDCAHASAA
ncbi:MAG: hypothetical protein U5R48_19925 [Gammaproteobacteria bacterium]|nr:hypothetical protein [Gammaproteobacteria bacterium]